MPCLASGASVRSRLGQQGEAPLRLLEFAAQQFDDAVQRGLLQRQRQRFAFAVVKREHPLFVAVATPALHIADQHGPRAGVDQRRRCRGERGATAQRGQCRVVAGRDAAAGDRIDSIRGPRPTDRQDLQLRGELAPRCAA
jgi:hypothetical protein